MTSALATINNWSESQLALIQQQIAKDCTPEEISLFGQVCQRTGLDPFSRQIYAIKRGGKSPKMTIQVSIDGFRTLAERTGKYGGSTTYWCGADGRWVDVWLSDEYPAAAKTVVYRVGSDREFQAVALWAEMAQWETVWKNGQSTNEKKLASLWGQMPAHMLGKCFSEDTEVLTSKGFELFSKVTGKVLQVTSTGLEETNAVPFSQPWFGEMIESNGDMLNFSVTPNHDMVTTVGKVEAQAMYLTAKTRAVWHIPLTVAGSRLDHSISDEQLLLAGYILADGSHNGHRQWRVSVSRPYKIEALRSVNPLREVVRRTGGKVTYTESRQIRTNFDKQVFSYECSRTSAIIDEHKNLNIETVLSLSQRQAKLLLDAWQAFDGHTNKKTSRRTIFTSRPDHLQAIEILAVAAGYCVNVPQSRENDISTSPNFFVSISSAGPQPVVKKHADRPGLVVSQNKTGTVWCVTVPSGKIIVRRNGFSMVCGNCSESHALRKAFPAELSGLYTTDEMPPATMEAEIIEPVALLPDERQELFAQCSDLFKQLGWGPAMRSRFLQTKFQVKSGEEMKLEQVKELAQSLKAELAAKEPADVA